MKEIFLLIAFISNVYIAFGQGQGISLLGNNSSLSFIDFQRTLPRPGDALKRKEDTLRQQFAAKNLQWPAKNIYIRSFKYDSEMEIWVRNDTKAPYQLFKTYKVCALAGSLGPKRMEGDYQVPEGFYYINEFNPKSNYHLSLRVNYPNQSDKVLSDMYRPGGDIYVHGSCVTVGCIPVNDQQIEEIYILAAYARNCGQDYIPIHIFPVRYDKKRSVDYLETLTKTDPKLKEFTTNLEKVFDHFEETRRLPVIMVNEHGEYVFDGLVKRIVPTPPPAPPKKEPIPHRHRDIANIAEIVNTWPEFPGGGEHFLKYLQEMGNALVKSLPDGKKKAYVIVEFIVDTDGIPTNFTMAKGVDKEFDDELISVLERMPAWKPALLNDKPVAKMVKQGFAIE